MDVPGAAEILRARMPVEPTVSVVLGSGLAPLADAVDGAVGVPFEDLPGLPPAGVAGHSGRFVAGRLGGADVLVHGGRYHAYEGHPSEVLAAPLRIAAAVGVRSVVLTNASGGIRPDLRPGALMLIEDHVNAMFRSPLVGPVAAGETRFPDMSAPYDAGMRSLARDTAGEIGLPLAAGTYAAVLGPSYETPAEVRMLERMGADVVGMSTVPEVLVGRALGLRCLAFSVVTNRAAGLGEAALSHAEVIEVGREAAGRLVKLLERLVPRLGAPQSGSTK